MAVVSPSSLSVLTPERLYDSVIGPATVGKSNVAPPWYFEASAAGGGTSVPENWLPVVPPFEFWRSV